MQSKTLKIIAALLIISAVFMGIIGYKISQQEIQRVENQTTNNNTPATSGSDYVYAQKLLISNKAFSKGEVITAEDIQLIPFPILVEDSYQKAAEVTGKPLEIDLAKGAIIRRSHFEEQSTLAPIIAPGYRGLSVKVTEVSATGGFLKPGDYVDVIFAAKASKETQEKSMTRRILRNVKVLAFGEAIEADSGQIVDESGSKSAKANDKDSGKRSRSAVLEVALDDVNMLILAEERGDLRLSAVGDADLAAALEADPSAEASDEEDKATFIREVTGLKPPAPPKSVYVYNGDSVETIRVPK
ncbi:Flp pilus assembly protein CpaB [Spongiibacter sp. KMU-158]|uniref:Flp pilus assembly protein CpaB n=1 Tax=Spongiibacter pelagi TaxID=2760804 RepID=A0A927BZJ1_9GAMM|nr:Flp pilus assembly protein CpaB [Spongiibacter pelagi]MBD2858478.1 Flp pilus assembly protein CpaB [Spongiibacter pelagi]